MKNLIILVAIVSTFSLNAFAEKKKALIITEVSVQTPLPTGLETMLSEAPDPAALPKAVFNHPDVKPILDTVTTLHEDKIGKNIEVGGAFYQEGYAMVDCEDQPYSFGDADSDYCGITVTKSFGWYADIDLAFVVKGYALKYLVE